MTSAPDARFAQLRHDDPRLGDATTTFVAAAPGQPPHAASHGVLADLAADDPERAGRVQAGLQQLIARNNEVMAWLEAGPANASLFASDPVAALHQALPDLPQGFFDSWTP